MLLNKIISSYMTTLADFADLPFPLRQFCVAGEETKPPAEDDSLLVLDNESRSFC